MRYILAIALALMLAAPVLAAKKEAAAPEYTGGFDGPVRGTEAETVEKALKLGADSRVVLIGNIVASIAGEKNQYAFKDATGEMPVVIGQKVFKDNRVTPEMKVQIIGKIEKDGSNPESVRLRASQLEILK